jgi:hypothetical protein
MTKILGKNLEEILPSYMELLSKVKRLKSILLTDPCNKEIIQDIEGTISKHTEIIKKAGVWD